MTDTTSIGIWTPSNEEERILYKWKKLQQQTQELVDIMIETGNHYKHPLEVMLIDINKLVTWLEQELK